ncbi:heme biosynthesis HemY N-terminal domain-containing protein [Halorhodospira halophila]|uniref:HemY domain protein n=1 Tax=Halorhodospira halophila (strain DSM 244 / SL1) TaxID=349124 RepID=A1WVU2_HALHL|nr:heme biosynthesis HemY N-terminal domain-containing protein [Halorhodospira halophila]ABM61804.1 HemY domain protein [Halorhodospira halophila SL1]MBK1728868.1 heme biosynthesis protein HemY [Halorhodospira halophila]
MRRLFIYLLILAGAVLTALYFNQQEGYVMLSIGPWRLEMSLLFSAVVLGLLVLLLYLALAALGRLWSMPRRLRSWQGQRRQESARTELTSGLLRFAEGDYDTAEQQLVHSARRSEAPLVNYLTAAIAAQRRGAREVRDGYLTTAEKSGPDANLAVRLLQAQLQAESGQWEEAQASVSAVLDKEPKHRRALELMVGCCRALGDWERLEPLLPRIERQGILPKNELTELNRWVARERLAQAAGEDTQALQEAWRELSRGLRKDPDVICSYVDGLTTLGEVQSAVELIQKQLHKEWNPDLLQRYARLPADDIDTYAARLEKAEGWIEAHRDDPKALYAAGVLALQAEQWERGRDYLQAAVDQTARPEYLRTLGALQEHLGDYDGARATYRLAMDLSGAGSDALPGLPGPTASGRTATPGLEDDSSAPPTDYAADEDTEGRPRQD